MLDINVHFVQLRAWLAASANPLLVTLEAGDIEFDMDDVDEPSTGLQVSRSIFGLVYPSLTASVTQDTLGVETVAALLVYREQTLDPKDQLHSELE